MERPHPQKRGPEAPEHLPSGTCGSWCLAEPCSRPGRPGQEGLHRQLPPSSLLFLLLLLPRGANTAQGSGGSRGQSCSAVLGRGCESHGEGNELGTELRGCGHWSETQASGPGARLVPTRRHQDEPSPTGMGVAPSDPCSSPGVQRGCVEMFLKARVSLGCPLGRRRLAVPLEAICECSGPIN